MRILFVHQGLQSFVRKDLDILRSRHEVRDICFKSVRDTAAVWRGAFWADVTFSWFGKLHAFFAVLFSKMLGKKAVVVAGGDDVAYEPQIGYGMFSYWWKKWCPLFVFHYADLILSVSEFNRRETIENAKADPARVKLVYHGFDSKQWGPMDAIHKDKLVLTVGRVTSETTTKKGLGLFVQTARHLPDVPFVLVGPWHDGVNGILVPAMDPSALATALNKLICDPALRQQYGGAGFDIATGLEEVYSWEALGDRVYEILVNLSPGDHQ